MVGLLLTGCPGSGSNGDGNSGSAEDAPDPETTGICTNSDTPCASVTSNNGILSCRLRSDVCGVDLDAVINQVGKGVTGDTVLWIQAWGARGGDSDKGCSGGNGGYAQTTTAIADIEAYNGSAQLYYYVAGGGGNGHNQCGSAGGSATIVTFEDLLPLPHQGPSLAAPPTLLVAGGGGGGSGANHEGFCMSDCEGDGGRGGVAIATTGANGTGAGHSLDAGWHMGGDLGIGGDSYCIVCNEANETGGRAAFGGDGGAGGSGPTCSGSGASGWINTGSIDLSMTSGEGGKGSSNTKACDAGGGGGGGGWGGGGGGGHANDLGNSVPGGGGGSFALVSTRASSSAPTHRPANPCSDRNGCVQIEFEP